jgi:4-azaleucine resistance transporter AzlC
VPEEPEVTIDGGVGSGEVSEELFEAAAAPAASPSAVRDGLAAAWPVCLGFIPIGLALGVLARKGGLEPWQIGVMSVVVFAGSSQFIAVSMIASGGTGAAIIGTTLMVNLRHLLMSSAMAPHLRGPGNGFLALFAYGITDESFAVNMGRFREGGWDPVRALTMNQAANAAWIVSTVLGGYAGDFIPAGAFGIDYALTAMFLCLLVYQLRNRLHGVVAAVAGVLAVALRGVFPHNGNVMVAAAVAAGVGVVLCRRRMGGVA